jgi:CheY-like chemotaxis protein
MLLLYVDDDKEDQEVFRDAIQKIDKSIELIFANDGEQAIKLLSNTDKLPSCIFMDLNMPLMGGKECLKIIKANPRLKDIDVVIFSTGAEGSKQELKKLGAKHVIAKPANFNELVRIVNTYLC